MSLMGTLIKAAAFGVAANATFTARRADCTPALLASSREIEGAATRDLVASMSLLDEGHAWSVEANDFGRRLRSDTAQLQILRLDTDYVDGAGQSAPVMRLVGLFPGVQTGTVHRRLTDPSSRLEWDSNYTFFEKFGGECAGTLQSPSLTRPLTAVAKRRPHCEGDVCTLVPDIRGTVVEHGWYAHGVGSPSLRRFGLVDRLFQYERMSTLFSLADEAAKPSRGADLYDILFSGAKGTRESAAASSPSLMAWLQAARSRGDCEGVEVNFQHILLIPVADVTAQLLQAPEQLRRLCTMGSMLDETAAKLVYDLFKDTQQREQRGAAHLRGTLLIMTSANNVNVPTFFPRWMQKKISGSVSRRAYGELMAACLRDEER